MEFAAQALSRGDRTRVETHLASCDWCRTMVSADLALRPEPARPAMPFRRRWLLPTAAAAGVLLAAGLWAGAGRWGKGGTHSQPLPGKGGLPIGADSGVYSTAQGQNVAYELPDGTRLALSERTRIRFLPRQPGERAIVELQSGELKAEVAKAPGAFRIMTRAGEIQVLGTRLRVKAFVLQWPGEAGSVSVPCACADLLEGRIGIRTPWESREIHRSGRAVLVQGLAPWVQELEQEPWQALLAHFDPKDVPSAQRIATMLWGANESWVRERPDPARRDWPAGLENRIAFLLRVGEGIE